MASLVKKIIRGNAYYYTRESQRVNGKPKVVRQIYLGRADDIDRHIPKRGQGPSVGTYLRIVGLALLVSADSHLPVLHSTYPGNRPDAPTFQDLCGQLTARCRAVANSLESVTLVFDKGNNSKANLAAVEASPFHVIGSLAPTHYPDLFAAQA